jgi:RNA polymerase sigma-70 factor (ECF subfamily)
MLTKHEPASTSPLPSDAASGVRRLFEQYQGTIFNTCCRLLDHEQDAEDITQDVFIRAFKAYPQFRAESSPGTWLYRIAVNLCLNHKRRQKYARWLSLDVLSEAFDAPPFESRESGPEEGLEKTETERIVREALQALPARQRTALILLRYEGLSYNEIARILECSESSVESLLHRAKHNLAKRLRPYLNEL